MAAYDALQHPLDLRRDLGWGERTHLQELFRRGNIWDEHMLPGHIVVRAEFQAAELAQRVDLLLLRADGGLLPCELKLGGNNLDSHGQLLRYMADIDATPVSWDWVHRQSAAMRTTLRDEPTLCGSPARHALDESISAFLSRHKLLAGAPFVAERAGILVDTRIHDTTRKAVGYLNARCGSSIRMAEVRAYGAESDDSDGIGDLVRIEIVEVEHGP